jgi:hypothetical protein
VAFVVVALAILLVVRARTHGDDGATASTSRSTTSSSVARDGGTTSDATTSGAVSTVTTRVPPPKALTQALLKKADLPGGWSSLGRVAADSAMCPGHDPGRTVPAKSRDSAGFSKAAAGPYITSVVQEFRDDKAAKSFLAASRSALKACASYEQSGLSYHLTTGTDPQVGDESLRADLVGQSTTTHISGRLLYARVGSRVATIVFFGTSRDISFTPATDALRTVAARL